MILKADEGCSMFVDCLVRRIDQLADSISVIVEKLDNHC